MWHAVTKNFSPEGFAGRKVFVLSALMALLGSNVMAAVDPKGVEYFESKVRPLLVERCYDCHSAAKKIKGGLAMDSKESMLKGGDTGPALEPGNPEASLMIKAVRYHDEDLKMPPKKPLSEEQVNDLVAWIKMGAPDPRSSAKGAISPFATVMAEGRKHWAFQPVKRPEPPKVKNTGWVRNPIDNFILAKLEEKGLHPAPPADKRTLMRRVYFDLIGLPPTPAEVEAFVADRSPDAYEKLIDKLLASPRYGERWGRHWLDVARYADTKGYLAGGEERRFGYSYTYRDYVINAFNKDLPYDEFIKEQIAADLMPLGTDKRPLAALGFITLGRRFLNNQNDIIDDRIDVVTRGLMGMTVVCARCHDHKFDPVPTKDYYSLHGIFASSMEPAEEPLLGIEPDPKDKAAYEAERKVREEKLDAFREKEVKKELAEIRRRTGDYLYTAWETKSMKDKGEASRLIRRQKLERDVIQGWTKYLDGLKKGHDAVFSPWVELSALPEAGFAAKAKPIIDALGKDSSKPVQPLIVRGLQSRPVKNLREVADRYNEVFAGLEKKFQDLVTAAEKKKAAAPTTLPDKTENDLRNALLADNCPSNVKPDNYDILLDGAKPKLRELKANVDRLDATHPGAPARAMALVDKPHPVNPVVFIRGNPASRGPKVPRQFLEILSGPDRKPYTDGSGRLQLASAIASKDNPLTARVYVNRVWMLHFGNPLVRTPADFGTRSDPPTHPEMLDYLAGYFMDNGWSIKKLHRLMLTSSAYMQSSDQDEETTKKYTLVDPSNFLLWKMNRERLDFEAMRDTILSVSGKLDYKQGGQPVALTEQPFSGRRSVYGFIDRQNLPGVFRAFDFPNPDTSTPQRFTTTVPQQALFFMNSQFLADMAQQLVERKEIAAATSDDERVRNMYMLAFQRLPSRDEISLASQYVVEQKRLAGEVSKEPVWQYGYGSFDEKSKHITEFHKLTHFAKKAWQASDKFPDPKLSYVRLTPEGGHPGRGLNQVIIRRWVAPQEGTVSVAGELTHPINKGDGVYGRVVSGTKGLLKEGLAFNGKAVLNVDKLDVKAGDVIDFVVDCRKETSFDSFGWIPQVTYLTGANGGPFYGKKEWNAQKDFGKEEPPQRLTGWEKYAQILLLSNELVFAD